MSSNADSAPAADGVVGLSHRQIQIVFSGLMAGMLLASLDQTVVSTALPTIVGELGGLEHLSWVITAYLLTSCSSMLLYGKLSDLYGRKLLFQIAIGIFLVGSLLSGVAHSMLQLVLFRGIQGLGAGGIITMSQAVIGDIVAPRERGRYQGYIGSVFAVSAVAGPLIGGFFTDHLTWRWVFYVNVPVGIAALIVTSAVLRLPFRRFQHRVDYRGAALMVSGISALLLLTSWGGVEYAWESPTIIGLGVAGVFLLSMFIVQEGRVAEPLLPLRLFWQRVFSVGSAISFIVGLGMVLQVPVLAVQNAVMHKDLGASTAGINLSRSLGSAFGIAIFGSILNNRLTYELRQIIPAEALARFSRRTLTASPAQLKALPPDIHAGVVHAFSLSLGTVFLWAVPLIVVGFLVSWLLREMPLRARAHVGGEVEGLPEMVGEAAGE